MRVTMKYRCIACSGFARFATLFFLVIYCSTRTFAQTATLENGPIFPEHQLLRDSNAIQKELKSARSLLESAPDSAIRKLYLSLKSSLSLNYNRGILKSLTDLGVFYHIHNQNAKAIAALQAALYYCDNTISGRNTAVNIYSAIAYRYLFLERNDSAAWYYYRALDEIDASHIKDPDILVNVYSQLILFWLNLNEDPEEQRPDDKYVATANAYLNKAEQLEVKNNITLGKIILSKGHIHYLMHRFDSARFHYHRFIALAKHPDMAVLSSSVTATYTNIARMFLIQKMPDSAILYSHKALQKFKEDGGLDSNLYISSRYNLGEAYNMQHKYQAAIDAALPALLAAETQGPSTQSAGHEILSEAYSGIGNYKLAWEHQKANSDIRDSISVHKSIQTISQMEMKYQMAERNKILTEKELALTSKDNKIKSQKLWIGGTLATTLLIILTGVLLRRQAIHKQKLDALQMQQEKDIALLQAMIDGEEKERNRLANELHDGIGGLLGAIRMQLGAALKTHQVNTQSGEFKHILLLLENAYDELRKTAHNLMPEVLQQEGLDIATSSFCDSIRKTDTLDVHYDTVGLIPRFRPNLELTLYRIIQELLHNIIKHARASEALVQLAFIGDCLSITVEDNGIGMPAAHTNTTQSGMGIKTIQERIRRMGGKFDISSAMEHGTSINIELHLADI
ncbi:tetratricopeptide repeat-containing sensor histidine kinase [Filimonas effusa]|uniref:Tetratricopeptide repeat protein n=1 Tax=Filimonas effusa TaxID=2508721 RepID=A0A4V1MAG9_9BACT|nr:sensor histidine kinase [Filimonas effusa]RXK85836.1 tetratricopeptide repeat protein [Filimonas effusa]